MPHSCVKVNEICGIKSNDDGPSTGSTHHAVSCTSCKNTDVCQKPIPVGANFTISVCCDFNDCVKQQLQKTTISENHSLLLTECGCCALFFAGVKTANLHYKQHMLRPNCYDIYEKKVMTNMSILYYLVC